MSSASETPIGRADIEADIARTRTQLSRTLEALMAKTDVKTRAKDASCGVLVEVGSRGLQAVSRTRDTIAGLLQSARGSTQTNKGRLSAAAVLAGAVTALLAAFRLQPRAGRR